ncbi:FAD-dependent oxidoreductase [Litchfieldella anticariensis]|uniref:FAD-dependent oxidoreductase n=1 Tax=Litchfieldella anticariensis TaxID=258591 RepID=UPI0003FF771D|nr:FAD-dependent oxidoreductase [Halomonas anticariensis]
MSNNLPNITEPAREIPCLLDADIIVVGGGTTGPMAALAAARQGQRVVLIERFGSLGGNMTLGLNTKPSGVLSGGIPLELWNLARSVGGVGADYVATTKVKDVKIASPCDPEIMKMLLTRLLHEAGVRVLFETVVSAPVMEDNKVAGVIIEGKGGRQYVSAKVVVDCSADADVAAAAGAPYVLGDGDAHAVQPVSMYFTLSNVDVKRLAEWAKANPDEVPARAIPENDEDLDYGLWLTGVNNLIRAYQKEKNIKLQRDNITLKTANGVLYVNATRVLGVDGLSPLEMSDAMLEIYRQIEAYTAFLVEKIPGFENAHIGQIAPVIGVRETRHIRGEYMLTGKDVIDCVPFEDTIAADNCAMDVHDVKGADVDFQGLGAYEIPYRCLVPLDVGQLLVAGRCISADHVAHGRTRNMPACMATGQAAGVAAAVAVASGTTVRDVDVAKVQEILRKMDMPLKAEEIS